MNLHGYANYRDRSGTGANNLAIINNGTFWNALTHSNALLVANGIKKRSSIIDDGSSAPVNL